MVRVFSVLGIAALMSSGAPALAGDEIDNVEFSAGLGVLSLRANEMVWQDSGSREPLSQLIWESTAPVATARLAVGLGDGWKLTARGQASMGGDSYMEDYDWLWPYATGVGQDDWSDRSQHDDTDLDWYFDGEVTVGRDFALREGVTANLNAGFSYTDVAWAAYGGSYVYSTGGFRDDIGEFLDGEPAISYRQQIPAVIGGVDLRFADGPWTLDVSGHAGVTVSAQAVDNHWMRDLEITDSLGFTPIATLSAEAGYQVTEDMAVVVGGSVEQVFMMRGDAEYDYPGEVDDFEYEDGTGADLFAATLTAGLRGTF